MTSNGTGAHAVEGMIEAANERGIKVGGEWYNLSKFRSVDVPPRGTAVRMRLDAKDFIQSIEETAPGGKGQAREQTISRLAVLKAAAAFAATREEIKSADVLKIASSWLAWVETES